MSTDRNKAEIVMKKSGKRARLEVTLDDLDQHGRAAPYPPPAPARAPAIQQYRGDLAPPTVQQRLPGPAGAPPGGGPPVRYMHEGPGGPWWQSRAASIAAGALLLVAVAVIAVVLLSGGSNPKTGIASDLGNTRSAVEDAAGVAGRATTLKQIRDAGRNAREQTARLTGPEANLRNADDRRLATPAATLARDERRYLLALSRLASVNKSAAGQQELTLWNRIKAGIVQSHRALAVAGARVERLGLPTTAGAVTVSQTTLESALGRVDDTVKGVNDKLLAYERETAAYERSKRRSAGSARPLELYRSNVIGILDQYARERAIVGDWADTAGEISRDDVQAAARTVLGFSNRRTDTISQLENALGSAPATVKSAHKDLGVPLKNSLDGLSSAASAVSEFEFDTDEEYDDLTQTPSWQTFQDESDAARNNLASRRQTWAAAIDAEISKMRGSNIAPKPRKPRV